MSFYDRGDRVCARLRDRGLVCVDAAGPRFDGESPYASFTACGDAAPYTNPYGGVLLVRGRLPHGMRCNTVLQEPVPEDRHGVFAVEDGERNPYTETPFGEADADLVQPVPDGPGVGRKALHRNAWLSYDGIGKGIRVRKENDGDVSACLFAMEKDEFVRLYRARRIDR